MADKSYFIFGLIISFLLLVYIKKPIQFFTLVIEISKNEDDNTCENAVLKIKSLISTFGSIKPTNISINNKKLEFKIMLNFYYFK